MGCVVESVNTTQGEGSFVAKLGCVVNCINVSFLMRAQG